MNWRFMVEATLYLLILLVNWQYADNETKLSDNNDIALIPPVTGGSTNLQNISWPPRYLS